MSDSTPLWATPEEYRQWWKEQTDVLYGTCWCRCGNETKLADRTHPTYGVKGEPRRWIGGHFNRGRPKGPPDPRAEEYREEWQHNYPDVPYGQCCCGCGAKTTISTYTSSSQGYVRDQPCWFITGHHDNGWAKTDEDYADARHLHREAWERDHPDTPYGYCICGCGEKTALAPQTDTRKGLIRGAPYKNHSWIPYASPQDRERRIKRSQIVKEERRRAREMNAVGSYTPEEVFQMYDDQQGLCAYCETPLFGTFHIDHIVPLSRGGRNDWGNLAISCPDCNIRKSTRTAEEFMTQT